MNKIKSMFFCLISVIMVSALLMPISACGEITGEEAYKALETFVNEDNIFEFSDEKVICVNIKYSDNLNKFLDNEKNQYLKDMNDNSKTEYMYSDFYIIKGVYEPLLKISLLQISEYSSLLKDNSSAIDSNLLGAFNNKLNELKESSNSFNTMLSNLNSKESEFADKTNEMTLKEYQNFYHSSTYDELRNYKKNYENLIRDCFELNSAFIDIKDSVIPTKSISELVTNDTKLESNSSVAIQINNIVNCMINKIFYVAFLIDGDDCSFFKNNKDSYSLIYDKFFSSNGSGFANNFAYNEHYNKALTLVLNKAVISESNARFDCSSLSVNPDLINWLNICEQRFKIFNQQLSYFVTAMDDIEYANFVSSSYSDAEELGVKGYAQSLTDSNEKAGFMTVYYFDTECFSKLIDALSNIIK